jgi:hypothetical protein
MGSAGIAPFLTSALDGGEWSASCPGRFTPREDEAMRCTDNVEVKQLQAFSMFVYEAGLAASRSGTFYTRRKNHGYPKTRFRVSLSTNERSNNCDVPTGKRIAAV